MIKVDLHVHSSASSDAVHSLPTILKICQRRGIKGLAITDHNVIFEMPPYLLNQTEVHLIPGEEIATSEGEIIGLFLDRLVPPGLSPEETICAIKEQGGISYLPHPLKKTGAKKWTRMTLEQILPKIDVIEVFNGRLLDAEANRQAARLAEETEALPGAGSDAHTAWEVGRVFVEMAEFDSPTSFLTSLRSGRIFGRPASWLNRIILNRRVRQGLRRIIPQG